MYSVSVEVIHLCERGNVCVPKLICIPRGFFPSCRFPCALPVLNVFEKLSSCWLNFRCYNTVIIHFVLGHKAGVDIQ